MKVTNPPTTDTSQILERSKASAVSQNPRTDAVDKTNKVRPNSASSVEISDDAKLMQKALELVRGAPDLRAQKVEELKKNIREGTYSVDAAKVADKLVDEHLSSDFGKNNL